MSPTLQRSVRLSRLPGICLAFALGSVAYAGIACDDPNNCQLPDQMGHGPDGTVAATSDVAAGFAVAENFAIDAGGTITDLCWWGTYTDFVDPCPDGDVADNFTITFMNNDPGCPAGAPGTILAGPFSPVVTKMATGNVIPSGLGDLIEYEYTATIPGGVVVGAGQCVWVEIQNDTTGGECLWLWETAEGDGGGFQSGVATNYDLAFCLNLPLGDTSVCALPLHPGCEGAKGDCGTPNGSPGCDEPCCCTLVCDADPICCINDWDEQCANAALECLGDCDTCGLPNCGVCFSSNGSAYCDDTCAGQDCPGCCDTVCALDPYCCDTTWDGLCAGEAEDLCGCQPEDAPANDDCVNAIPIGLGITNVSNTCGTVGGPDHGSCNDGFSVGLGLDVWYSFTPDFSGAVTITPTPEVGWNTQLAIYEDCNCDELEDPPYACAGVNSGITIPVNQGTCYLIRLGGEYQGASGAGTLTLEPADIPKACVDGQGSCLEGNGSPGCDDTFCCIQVCEIDPNCCDVDWDQACADLAAQNCPAVPCVLNTAGANNVEAEICGDDTNGGCNSDPPVYENVSSGDIIHGTAWADGGTRDTDWYVLNDLASFDTNGNGLVDVHNNIVAELPMASFIILDTLGDCSDTPIVGTSSSQSCSQTNFNVSTVSTTDIVYVWAGTAQSDGTGIFNGFPCTVSAGSFGNNYIICVTVVDDGDPFDPTCEAPGNPCPADFDLSGDVGVKDLLFLLGAWGPCPPKEDCPADFDLSGDVGVKDLLFLLGAWGPC